MKFAIYGDSYADAFHYDIGNYNHLTWASHLALMLGATTIDYHAQGSTPFVYSYRKIMDTADSYDRIIVAVTEPSRYTQPVEGNYITDINNINSIKNNYTRRHLFGWFYSQDELFMSTVQELMLQQITKKFPTAILVPCFPDSFNTQRRNSSIWRDVSLCNFAHVAIEQAGFSGAGLRYQEVIGKQNLLCHMPADWQIAIARTIHRAIQSSQPVSIPKNLILRYPISNYYKKP